MTLSAKRSARSRCSSPTPSRSLFQMGAQQIVRQPALGIETPLRTVAQLEFGLRIGWSMFPSKHLQNPTASPGRRRRISRRAATQTSPRNYPESCSQREPKRPKACYVENANLRGIVCGAFGSSLDSAGLITHRTKFKALHVTKLNRWTTISIGFPTPRSGQAHFGARANAGSAVIGSLFQSIALRDLAQAARAD